MLAILNCMQTQSFQHFTVNPTSERGSLVGHITAAHLLIINRILAVHLPFAEMMMMMMVMTGTVIVMADSV